MKFIADFHIHSRYSRATSPKTDIHNLAMWAKIKGVDVLGTGDCTHGEWLKHVKEVLIPAEQGLYRLKDSINDVRFIITGEISCIYKKNDKVRKVHILIIMSSIEAAERLNVTLMSIGANLRSDGRPIIGLDTKELLKMCLEADSKCLFVPAHCFTPWFGIFGSKSGFDSLDECFEEMSPHVLAVESGLSSDPPMIWRIPDGERLAIISNSDAHRGRRLVERLMSLILNYHMMLSMKQLRIGMSKGFFTLLSSIQKKGSIILMVIEPVAYLLVQKNLGSMEKSVQFAANVLP